jgi:hypothetical protein
MWMEERMGKKVNTERTDEALASASDTVAVGCPFCNIMLSDWVQERKADDRVAVRDVAQLLLEAIEFHPDSNAAKANSRDGSGNGDGHYPSTKQSEDTTRTPAGPGDPETT